MHIGRWWEVGGYVAHAHQLEESRVRHRRGVEHVRVGRQADLLEEGGEVETGRRLGCARAAEDMLGAHL